MIGRVGWDPGHDVWAKVRGKDSEANLWGELADSDIAGGFAVEPAREPYCACPGTCAGHYPDRTPIAGATFAPVASEQAWTTTGPSGSDRASGGNVARLCVLSSCGEEWEYGMVDKYAPGGVARFCRKHYAEVTLCSARAGMAYPSAVPFGGFGPSGASYQNAWSIPERYWQALRELWAEQLASGGHDSREAQDVLQARADKLRRQVIQLEKDLALVAQLGPRFGVTTRDRCVDPFEGIHVSKVNQTTGEIWLERKGAKP